MTEHSILFSGPMVRAILDGRQTMTRRVVKPQPSRSINDWTDDAEPGEFVIYHGYPHKLTESRGRNKRALGELTPIKRKCPYGNPGDRLWVRETWQDYCPMWKGQWYRHGTQEGIEKDHRPVYKADDPSLWVRDGGSPLKWRPSMFMPRWASRINLTITAIRVERVQDISGEDTIKEGWNRDMDLFPNMNTSDKALAWFRQLWDSLKLKSGYGWNTNPWVWVISFEATP